MQEIHGDLLTSTAQYIVHQCNATGNYAAGLAAFVNKVFPHADIYTSRKPGGVPEQKQKRHPQYPGNIVVRGDGANDRFVICLIGQFYPGGPRLREFDTNTDREKWFGQCLEKIEELPDLKSISFPFQIGCGIAGGNWTTYRQMIAEFAARVEPDGTIVTIINPNP